MTRNFILVGAVAAMLALSTGARAQDTTTSTTTTTAAPAAGSMSTTSTTTTTTPAAGMSGGMMSSGVADYTLLNSKTLDYTDLMAAKARGLSDDQIATVAKIAEKTGVSFRDVTDAVIRGETFATLADMYNLKLADVLDVNDEKTKIENYKATYEMTGWKNVGMTSMMDTTMPTAPSTSTTTSSSTSTTTTTGQ